MHQAVPAILDFRASWATLPRMTTSKPKRRASTSTPDRAPIARRTAPPVRSGPCGPAPQDLADRFTDRHFMHQAASSTQPTQGSMACIVQRARAASPQPPAGRPPRLPRAGAGRIDTVSTTTPWQHPMDKAPARGSHAASPSPGRARGRRPPAQRLHPARAAFQRFQPRGKDGARGRAAASRRSGRPWPPSPPASGQPRGIGRLSASPASGHARPRGASPIRAASRGTGAAGLARDLHAGARGGRSPRHRALAAATARSAASPCARHRPCSRRTACATRPQACRAAGLHRGKGACVMRADLPARRHRTGAACAGRRLHAAISARPAGTGRGG
jgi:hypothetical protein